MNEDIQLRDAHRAYANQAFGKPGNKNPTLAIKEIWRDGDAQLTVYTKIGQPQTQIPSPPYQRAWHTEHPKARKLTQ